MRALVRFLLPALLVAGCASTTQVPTRFTADESHPPQGTLLLVAHTPEGNTRETWELTCKEIFSSGSLTILLSHQGRTGLKFYIPMDEMRVIWINIRRITHNQIKLDLRTVAKPI